MRRLGLSVLLLFSIFAGPAQAQQQRRTPSEMALAIDSAVNGMAQSLETLLQQGRALQAQIADLQKQIADLKKKCGDRCEKPAAPKPTAKP